MDNVRIIMIVATVVFSAAVAAGVVSLVLRVRKNYISMKNSSENSEDKK